jgi:hypothetical protein
MGQCKSRAFVLGAADLLFPVIGNIFKAVYFPDERALLVSQLSGTLGQLLKGDAIPPGADLGRQHGERGRAHHRASPLLKASHASAGTSDRAQVSQ